MKAKTLLLIAIVAAVSAGATFRLTKSRAPAASAEHAEEPAKIEIPGLKVEPATAGEGWNTLVLTGRIAVPSDRLVKVSPRIEGKVVAAYPKVGDNVRRGQVLAVISSVELAEARAQYRQAAARLDAAQRNLAQERQAVKLGAVSARPVEEARGESLEAQGSLADAKSDLIQAKSDLVKAESEYTQCKARLDRARELYADQIVSKQDVETAEAESKMDSAAVDAARSKISQAETRIEKSKARGEIAQQYLAREEKVFKGKMLDARAVQSAKAAVTAAKAEVTAATERISVLGASPNGSGETISVTCPISGRVVSRHINVGEMATPADALFTVADLSRVWAEADVYEKDLGSVRRGMTAEIRVEAYPDRVFSGKVDSIGDILSPESRTAKVRCIIPNPSGVLKGEMFARVSLITSRRGGTVLIPKQAVLDDAGKKIVFTTCTGCQEDKAKGPSACGEYDKVEITTGPVHGNQIEVLKGIDPGTEVITVGQHQIKTALGSGQLKAGCKDECEN